MAGEGAGSQPPHDILGLSWETPPVLGVEKPCWALGWESQSASSRTGPLGLSVSPGGTGMSREPENCLGPSLTQEALLHCSDSDMLPCCRAGGLQPPDPHYGGTEITWGWQLGWAVFCEGELPTGRGLCHPILLTMCYLLRILLQEQMFVELLLCAWHCSRWWGTT